MRTLVGVPSSIVIENADRRRGSVTEGIRRTRTFFVVQVILTRVMVNKKPTYLEMQREIRRIEGKFTTLQLEWRGLLSDVNDEAQRLAAVVNDSNDAITLQDLEGNILAWNHGAEMMYGWTQEEALGTNMLLSVPESCHGETLQLIARIAGGENITSFETQRVTKDGQALEVWLTLTPLKDIDQKIYAIASTERDITQRKQAEAEKERYLQEALAKIKVLTGLLPICASCKKIRDAEGHWNQIESYIRDRSEATFSHSVCPDCMGKFYPAPDPRREVLRDPLEEAAISVRKPKQEF